MRWGFRDCAMEPLREWDTCCGVSTERETAQMHMCATYRADLLVAAILAAHAQALHALLQRLSRVSLELAERNAAVLVVCSHLFPLLDLGDAGGCDGSLRVGDGLASSHVADLDKRDGNQARAAQSGYGLCDKPLGVGLGDDDDGLALLGLELVGALCLEVVNDDAVDHGARLAARAGHAHLLGHDVVGGRRVGAYEAFLVAGVVRLLGSGARRRGTGTVAHRLAHALKVRDGNQAAGAVQRVAGFVPVAVVFAADDVQKVALGKGKIGRVGAGVGGLVVVEGFYDLK